VPFNHLSARSSVVPQSAISGMTVTVTSTGQKVSKTITLKEKYVP